MAWRRTGNKPLSKPMTTLISNAYMRHKGRWVKCSSLAYTTPEDFGTTAPVDGLILLTVLDHKQAHCLITYFDFFLKVSLVTKCRRYLARELLALRKLTHRGRDKMIATSQTIFSFSCIKSLYFFIKTSVKYVPMFQLTIIHHWVR